MRDKYLLLVQVGNDITIVAGKKNAQKAIDYLDNKPAGMIIYVVPITDAEWQIIEADILEAEKPTIEERRKELQDELAFLAQDIKYAYCGDDDAIMGRIEQIASELETLEGV